MDINVANQASRREPQYNFAALGRGGIVCVALMLWVCAADITQAAGLSAAFQTYGGGDYGTAVVPPKPLPVIELVNELGEPFATTDLKGHPTILFFGFTHCPHVCPTTLAMLRGIRERLPAEEAEKLQIWLVSVDPMRDTAEQMREYLTNFGPGFHGARADLGELVPLFKSMGVGYAYRADEDGGSYDVDHTTTIFLLNNDAALARVYTSPHDADGLLRSLREQLK